MSTAVPGQGQQGPHQGSHLTTTPKWVATFADGHSLWERYGFVYLKDDSGDWGTVDTSRPVVFTSRGIFAPLVLGMGTPVPVDEALFLVRKYDMTIQVDGDTFKLQEVGS